MQGEYRKVRALVTQPEYDRMLTSSDWTAEQIAEMFEVDPGPTSHPSGGYETLDETAPVNPPAKERYTPNRAARRKQQQNLKRLNRRFNRHS